MHTLTLRPVPGSPPGMAACGMNTQVLLDGKPLEGVTNISFDGGGVAPFSVKIEMMLADLSIQELLLRGDD